MNRSIQNSKIHLIVFRKTYLNLQDSYLMSKKVIYIDVEKSKELESFSNTFSAFFNGLGFELGNAGRLNHPHVTLAFRDLKPEHFEKAWPHFQNESFSASFNVMSVHLLKHQDNLWTVVKEFSFG